MQRAGQGQREIKEASLEEGTRDSTPCPVHRHCKCTHSPAVEAFDGPVNSRTSRTGSPSAWLHVLQTASHRWPPSAAPEHMPPYLFRQRRSNPQSTWRGHMTGPVSGGPTVHAAEGFVGAACSPSQPLSSLPVSPHLQGSDSCFLPTLPEPQVPHRKRFILTGKHGFLHRWQESLAGLCSLQSQQGGLNKSACPLVQAAFSRVAMSGL